MTDRVDAGDLLKVRSLEIADDDTAFTLNVRCYEAAIESFAELVRELSEGRVLRVKQNLDERVYYGKEKRPRAAATLLWNRPAEDLDALVRALNFSDRVNPIALPKISIDGEFVAVVDLEVTGTSSTRPGTIVRIDEVSAHVSTLTRDVAIRSIQTLDGAGLPVSEFVERFGLKEGSSLPVLDEETAERISAINEGCARHEAFWLDRLAALEPADAGSSTGPVISPRDSP
jgi:methionyl-tRNA formyltransferase